MVPCHPGIGSSPCGCKISGSPSWNPVDKIDWSCSPSQTADQPPSVQNQTLQRGSFQTNQTLINPDLQPNSEMGSRLQGSVSDFGLGNHAPLPDPGIETQQARLLGIYRVQDKDQTTQLTFSNEALSDWVWSDTWAPDSCSSCDHVNNVQPKDSQCQGPMFNSSSFELTIRSSSF